MTQDIIEMARQAHVDSKTWIDIYSDKITVGEVRNFLEAFAKLAAAKERERVEDLSIRGTQLAVLVAKAEERERLAKVFDAMAEKATNDTDFVYFKQTAAAIRNIGEA